MTFEARIERVLPAEPATVLDHFSDTDARAGWLPGNPQVNLRERTHERAVLDWLDGQAKDTELVVEARPSGTGTRLVLAHKRLATKEAHDVLRAFWGFALDRLQGRISVRRKS